MAGRTNYEFIITPGGRECIMCEEYFDYVDPETDEPNFYANRTKPHGFSPMCKECHAEERRERLAKHGDDPSDQTCPVCGGWIEKRLVTRPTKTGACSSCSKRLNKHGMGYCYLVVTDPEGVWRGGHWSNAEMKDMLKSGYWPEGLEFEEWKHGDYMRLVSPVQADDGRQKLQEVDREHEPVGDGIVLIP